MKIKACVVGLGYVGLPLILNLSKKISCVGFDVDKSRIENLKLKKDTNKEFKPTYFEKKNIIFQLINRKEALLNLKKNINL